MNSFEEIMIIKFLKDALKFSVGDQRVINHMDLISTVIFNLF
jgi:hypothetical protein